MKEELREKSLAGMAKCAEQTAKADENKNIDDDDDDSDQTGGRGESDMEQDDDDAEYYRQEVGEEPDPDIFHSQHSATVKKSDSKRRAKVPVCKQLSKKQKSKMVTQKSSGKFKKDSMNQTSSKTVQENSYFHAGRKRHFQMQRNAGKRKKRKM